MKLSKLWAVIPIAFIALLFYYSANARNTTFAWDADSSWPVGTTIELEANGATATGITTNQHTLDIPVQPGEVISEKVRAIPPVGYQCGDPIDLCKPSEWVSLSRTIPSVPFSIWARTDNIGVNGVTAPTFVAQYATAFNVSTSPKTAMSAVSISSGDVIVIVGVIEDAKSTSGWSPTYSEDGSSAFANTIDNSTLDYSGVSSATYTATNNESITITAARGSSATTTLFFGANAVRFSGSSGIGNTATDSGSGSPSISITTTQNNSAIVVIFADWNATTGTQTFTSNGGAGSPTNLTGYAGDGSHYGAGIAYYADAGTAGSKTVGMSAPTGQKWRGIAIEVKGTESGGSPAISAISYHRMQHGMQ